MLTNPRLAESVHRLPSGLARCGSSPPFDDPFAVLLRCFRTYTKRARRVSEAYRRRVPPPAARLTSVPGMAAAVPMATAHCAHHGVVQFAHRQCAHAEVNTVACTDLPLDAV